MGGRLGVLVRCVGAFIVMAFFLLPTVWSEIWNKISVSQAKINPSKTLKREKAPSGIKVFHLYCSIQCQHHPEWCELWCWDPSTEECILTDSIATGGYQETNSDDALTCYTKRPKELVTSAVNISAGKQDPNFPLRTKENLIDGFYNYDGNLCFKSPNGGVRAHQWFMIDFGSPKTFSHVVVKVRPGGWAKSFVYAEVRVGTTEVPLNWDGMGDHQLFGFFPGPATDSQEVLFEVSDLVTARYVSVRKMTGANNYMICHVEVY